MAFCTKCGSKLSDDAIFCGQCGASVKSDFQNTANSQSETANQTGGMRESFSPKFGVGGKSFTFTDDCLIYGSESIPYSQLTTINLLTPPTMLTNGVAQTRTKDGKIITLAYDSKQKDRFATALNYANEQIDGASDNKKYVYIFQSPTGTKIEVYDSHIEIYFVSEKTTKILGNIIGGGASGKIVQFSDISDIVLNEPVNGYNGTVQFIYPGATEGAIPIAYKDIETIKKIINHIKNGNSNETEEIQIPNESWEAVKGEEKSFKILDKALNVTANLDEYNTYRLKFRELAVKCANCARTEYNKKIHNLESYVEFFPKIYNQYLDVLIQKAIDVFVVENIWSITKEAFAQQHKKDFHITMDNFNVTLESIELTSNANQKKTSSMMSVIPNLRGGGFGLKGAMKGIATATAFNVVRDNIEASAVKNAANINQSQRNELYNRINPDILFKGVFLDYFNVFVSLIFVLNKNGHTIKVITKNEVAQADNIFKNLSNPNFPQDKIVDAMINIINTNPYNSEYYKLFISKFGKTNDIIALMNYFGIAD